MVSSKSASKRQNVGAKRPYSEYNIFYRLERMRILQSSGTKIDDETVVTLAPADHHDPIEHPRPQKYAGVRLQPYWYSSFFVGKSENAGGMPKRKHRKLPGRVGMGTLSKMISESWRDVDPETKVYCKMLAKTDALLFKKRRAETKSSDEERTRSNQVSKCVDTNHSSLSAMSEDGFYCKEIQPVQPDVTSNVKTEQDAIFFPNADDRALLVDSFDNHKDIQPLTDYNSFSPRIQESDAMSLYTALANPVPEESLSSGPKFHFSHDELVGADHGYSASAETAPRTKYPFSFHCHPCSDSNASGESSQHFQKRTSSCAASTDTGTFEHSYFRTNRDASVLPLCHTISSEQTNFDQTDFDPFLQHYTAQATLPAFPRRQYH